VICEISITYYIDRAEYQLEVSQKFWPAAHFI